MSVDKVFKNLTLETLAVALLHSNWVLTGGIYHIKPFLVSWIWRSTRGCFYVDGFSHEREQAKLTLHLSAIPALITEIFYSNFHFKSSGCRHMLALVQHQSSKQSGGRMSTAHPASLVVELPHLQDGQMVEGLATTNRWQAGLVLQHW